MLAHTLTTSKKNWLEIKQIQCHFKNLHDTGFANKTQTINSEQ